MHRTALITGAARRIGRRMAIDLARQGWDVAVHYNSSAAAAREVAEEIRSAGRRAAVVQGDLADPAAPQSIVAEAVAELGPLTCLVNNASRFEPDMADTVTVEQWDLHLNTNLRSPVFLAQAFAAQLPEGENGNIINIIDQRVWKLNPTFFSYTASKSALWGLVQSLAQELAPRIRVNLVSPGWVRTPMTDEALAAGGREARITAAVPLGRIAEAEDVAAAVAFLADDDQARHLTGVDLPVSGGALLPMPRG